MQIKDTLREFKADLSPGYHFCMGIWLVVDNGDKIQRSILNGESAIRALEDALAKTNTVKEAVSLIELEMRNKVRNT